MTIQPKLTTLLLRPMTIRVGSGSSTPRPANNVAKVGTAYLNKAKMTSAAMAITAIGSIITENWRVKTASSFWVTFPATLGFGMAISRPFSTMRVGVICSRRRTASSASRLGEARTPVICCPVRDVPRNSNCGIASHLTEGSLAPRRHARLSARGGVGRLRTLSGGWSAAGDHILELLGIARTGQGRLQGDALLLIKRVERLVESLHAELFLSGLHR